MSEKKKRKNSRNIGATYERRVAKLFTEWWGRGEFIRTASMQVVGHSQRLAHGDIACVIGEPLILDQEFPFSCEMKKSEAWSWMEFFKGNPSLVMRDFWKQCRSDAALWDKDPLLVFTQNRHPDYIMVRRPIAHSGPFKVHTFKDAFQFEFEEDSVMVMTLQNFFGALEPRHKSE